MKNIHGDYTITVSEKIISIVLRGAFNEVGFQGIAVQLREIVATFAGQSFCILVDDCALTGATPEAYQELEALNQWLNTQKMQAKALVINSVVKSGIIKKHAPSIQQQRLKIFDNKALALQWLMDQQANR